MNLKNLFKALFALVLCVIVFVSCTPDDTPDGEATYSVKYGGKVVGSGSVIVITMDDYDAVSQEIIGNFEIVNTGDVKTKFEISSVCDLKYNIFLGKYSSAKLKLDTARLRSLLAEEHPPSHSLPTPPYGGLHP